jgi:hypothetical protein
MPDRRPFLALFTVWTGLCIALASVAPSATDFVFAQLDRVDPVEETSAEQAALAHAEAAAHARRQALQQARQPAVPTVAHRYQLREGPHEGW